MVQTICVFVVPLLVLSPANRDAGFGLLSEPGFIGFGDCRDAKENQENLLIL